MSLDSALSGRARELLARRLGLHFSEDRQAELERTLLESAGASGRRAPDAWLALLASRPLADPMWIRLIARLTIGETHFWRDHACFEALEHHVLPDLITARRSRRTLRIWSAACSTGEEPYSLAILLDRLLLDRASWDVTVLATDLNATALATARRGLYRPWSLRDVPAVVRDRYFRGRGARGIEVDPEIRRMVRFETVNLTEPFPATVTAGSMDLVLCRNVLMYLTPEAAGLAIAHLLAALADDGWLIVAPAEASAQAFRPLQPVSFPGVIFFRAGTPDEVARPQPAATVSPRKQEASDRPQRVRASRSGAVPPAARPADPVPATALPAGPERPDELKTRAQALADGGSLDAARELCEQALAADRLDAGAYRLLAAIEQEGGRPAPAMEALRRALYLDPDSSESHLALGRLLLAHGERGAALRHIETAERLRQMRGEAS